MSTNEVVGRKCFHSCLSICLQEEEEALVTITHDVLDLTVQAPQF